MSQQLIDIDGSYLEGGGQILRNALSLSCILRRPIRVHNIRANRPNPGLSHQHLYGLNLLQQVTGATVRGNALKSTEVIFHPGAIRSDNYTVDTKTAASVSLVLQAALPVLLFANATTTIELIGGTNVGMAPQVDFMTEVFRPNLEQFGASFDFDLFRRGYYPRGGGRVQVRVPPVRSLQRAELTNFGALKEICGWCFVAGRLPLSLAQQMKNAAERELLALGGAAPYICIEAYKESADMARDNGAGLVLKATSSANSTLGASALGGAKYVDAESLGQQAAQELNEYIRRSICVDSHVQDQLILFMALAKGTSRIRTCALTSHTRTAIHVAELITGVKYIVEELDKGNVIITCQGIGHQNCHL